MNFKVIATDFDGTLCEDKYPEIGEPIWWMIEYLKTVRKHGNKVILWTCRSGERLEQAVKWCSKHGMEFDAVNDNIPELVEKFGSNSRKIYADMYFDDKAYSPF